MGPGGSKRQAEAVVAAPASGDGHAHRMVTGDEVISVADLLGLRLHFAAHLGRMGTARMEPAAAGRGGSGGQFPLDVSLFGLNSRSGLRDRCQQCPGVGVGGPPVDLLGGTDLAHLAEVHHHDPVAHVLDHGQVMRDEQHGQAVALLHLLEQVEDLGLDRDVQRGHGLVADQHLGVESQCPGNADPLALPARELVRAPVAEPRLDADGLHQLVDAIAVPLPALVAPHDKALADHVSHLAPGIER